VTYRPGRNLVTCAIVLAVLCLGTFVWTPFAAVPAVGCVLLVILAEIDRRRVVVALRSVSVSRTLPVVAGRDRPFVGTLLLQNSGQYVVNADVRDVVPADCRPAFSLHRCVLAAGNQQQVTETYRIPNRGQHHFGPVWLRASGPWQLMDAQQAVDSTGRVRVLPETFASWDKLTKDTAAQLMLLDKATRTRHHGVGTEFESLHAFRDGDDPRRIDWRATARMRQPIVRRFQIERHRDVMILIDCGRLMGSDTGCGSKLDCAVDAALNLSRVALQSGDRCGVAAYDSEVRGFLPPVVGIKSLGSIVDCVYDLHTEYQETDFTRIHAELQTRQSKRSLVVVLSDLSDAETSRLQCASLRTLSRRHLVLFAALRTPLLNQIIHAPVDTVLDGAKQAVTYRLLRDRGQALYALERSGVHVLDIEPQQLTVPLINQFVALRQRNLL
jgi:uncharacterized protein (DUF58 family)